LMNFPLNFKTGICLRNAGENGSLSMSLNMRPNEGLHAHILCQLFLKPWQSI